jgi:hypothetical protein
MRGSLVGLNRREVLVGVVGVFAMASNGWGPSEPDCLARRGILDVAAARGRDYAGENG